jgi:hypothetical protein
VQGEPHLVGERATAAGAVGGELSFVQFDEVLGPAARVISTDVPAHRDRRRSAKNRSFASSWLRRILRLWSRQGGYSMVEDRFLKRLRKKARNGLRGWPIATVAFYGPNLSQATKVAVGIVPSENAAVEELRDWKVDRGDIRSDPDIAREMLEFIEEHRVKSVAITDGIIGCPHQEGIDYDGEWCPVCEFWHGRDRFTGQRVH